MALAVGPPTIAPTAVRLVTGVSGEADARLAAPDNFVN